jgi:DNA-binding NtrC family response regulator
VIILTISVSKNPVVLIVDDQFRALQPLIRLIASERFTPLWVPNAREALAIVNEPDNDVQIQIIIVDLKSTTMGGVGFLHQVRLKAPRTAVLITGPISPFLYLNGQFYEIKDQSIKRNINTVLDAICQKQKIEPEKKDKKKFNYKNHYGIIIGKSRRINEIYTLIDNLKNSTATVLIQGNSGTGKELVARTIHQTSKRKKNHLWRSTVAPSPPI